MFKVKVLTNITTECQSDGMEIRHFSALSDENKICMVSLIRYREGVSNIVPQNILLISNAQVTQRPDITLVTIGPQSMV